MLIFPKYFCFCSCSLFSWAYAYPRYGRLAYIFSKERKGSYKGYSTFIIDSLVTCHAKWIPSWSYCSSICSPHIVLWMAISTLWMWSTVHPYHLRAPIFLPGLPELKRLHNEHQTQKIPRNTTKWWRVCRQFSLHAHALNLPISWMIFFKKNDFLGWFVNTDSWNRGDDPWLAEGWLEEGGRQLPFIILALLCSQQHTCMHGTVLFWTSPSGMIFSLQPIQNLPPQYLNSLCWCRSRTSGFTTPVLELSRTSRTASSSRSHGHVFLRIYSISKGPTSDREPCIGCWPFSVAFSDAFTGILGHER